MHTAILRALRLNSDRSERQRGGDRCIGGRRDGDADHAAEFCHKKSAVAPRGPPGARGWKGSFLPPRGRSSFINLF